MELAQIPELDLVSSSYEALESEQMKIGSQRILVSDHINAYQYSSEKVDSFVIDMDSFSSTINKDIINANSRTTLQRSLSRKGSQRGGDRNVSGNVTLQDKDIVPTTCSPKASLLGSSKSTVVPVGSTQNSTNPQQVHHQITVTTASNMCNTNTENKSITRRSSFGRSSSWLLDPKKVLLVFATLSSVGTLLLIFLTLSISKHNGVEHGSDLQ